jgi:cytochrome c-type biogenesis protein CcmH
MIIWIVLTVMTVVVAAAMTVPLVRRHDARLAGREASLAVLRDQLRDVDDQERAGAVTAPEAQSIRTEIKRRLLAEGGRAQDARRPLAQDALGRVAIAMAAVIALAVTGIYAMVGRPDLAAPPASAPAATPTASGQAAPGVDAMIARLVAHLEASPDDAEGWRALGWSYSEAGRYGDAVASYRRAVALTPDAPGFQSALGEALVLAADGRVTPDAAATFRKVLALDAADPRARYFLAMARDQAGDRKGALEDWIALLRDAPADAPWAAELRAMVQQAATEQGVDLAGRLPDAPAAPRGPSATDVANAEAMTTQDRQAMVQAMVDGLAARLKQDPRDADGWDRLMRSRMVLGDAAGARAALAEGKKAFADDPAIRQRLDRTAASLGL